MPGDRRRSVRELSTRGANFGGSAPSIVYKVKDTRTGNRLVKKILSGTVHSASFFKHELKYLKEIDPCNIVKFFGAYILPDSVDVVI